MLKDGANFLIIKFNDFTFRKKYLIFAHVENKQNKNTSFK